MGKTRRLFEDNARSARATIGGATFPAAVKGLIQIHREIVQFKRLGGEIYRVRFDDFLRLFAVKLEFSHYAHAVQANAFREESGLGFLAGLEMETHIIEEVRRERRLQILPGAVWNHCACDKRKDFAFSFYPSPVGPEDKPTALQGLLGAFGLDREGVEQAVRGRRR